MAMVSHHSNSTVTKTESIGLLWLLFLKSQSQAFAYFHLIDAAIIAHTTMSGLLCVAVGVHPRPHACPPATLLTAPSVSFLCEL